MIQNMEGQITLFDLIEDTHVGCVGKMSLVHTVRPAVMTSDVSLKSWQELKSQKFQYLCLKAESGQPTGQSAEMVGALLGERLMRNIGEYPKDVEDATLSAILIQLTDEQLQKYCLSMKACLGILRRGKKRGKVLPEVLKIALMRGAGLTSEDEIGEPTEDDDLNGRDISIAGIDLDEDSDE